MNLTLGIFIFAVGYLFGSISIARITTRLLQPNSQLNAVEIPDAVSGGTYTLKTVGATTASMLLGPKVGGMIGILDIFKGAVPALITRLVFPDQPYFLIIGIAVVVGHIWPVYYNFRGGGGLSPALGALLVLDPLGTLICVILAMLIGMFILKEIAFIVMGGPMLFIIWTALISRNWVYILFAVVLNLLLIIAVIPDMKMHFQAVKSGKTDLSSSMDSIPMGQMMKRMMTRMGLEKSIKK